MRNIILTLSCCCLALGCATEAGMQPDSQAAAPSASAAAAAPSTSPTAAVPSSPAAPGPRRPVVFSDLPNFDRELGQSLSGAKDPVVVTSADHISLRQLPPRLEKWLAAVDDSGGKIETQSVDAAAEPQTRSLGLIFALIGAIRQAREFAKAQIYSEARNFDAKIFYKLDANGDRVMDRVEMIRRQR